MNPSTIGLLCLAIGFVSLTNNLVSAKNAKRQDKNEEFICPADGKWPHESNCGKYYQCRDGIVVLSGWCGPKMSFDADNQRCEMAYGINCNDGDRPDWVKPDGWMGTTKSTTTTTRRTRVTRSTSGTVPSDNTGATTLPDDSSREGQNCSFDGLVEDKSSCQRYFYCKESKTRRATCIDSTFFDIESLSCKDSSKVDCGSRPISSINGNRCKTRPNGIYPNYENGCTEFFHCNNQEEVKKGDCPQGLKFNSQTLRCDWPSNILAPCGTKQNTYGSQNSASNFATYNLVFAFGSAVLSLRFL